MNKSLKISAMLLTTGVMLAGCTNNPKTSETIEVKNEQISVNYQVITLDTKRELIKDDINKNLKKNSENVFATLKPYGEYKIQTESKVFIKGEKVPQSTFATSNYVKDVKNNSKIMDTYTTGVSSETMANYIGNNKINVALTLNIQRLESLESYKVKRVEVQVPLISNNTFKVNLNVPENENTLVSITQVSPDKYQLLFIDAKRE